MQMKKPSSSRLRIENSFYLGAELEYADEETLRSALEGRR